MAFVVADPADWDNVITEVLAGTKYQGFNPAVIRQRLRDAGVTTGELIAVVSAYTQVGNNLNKLANPDRLTNAEVCTRALNAARRLGIESTGDRSNLTLSNVAIAFLPVLCYVRQRGTNEDHLQDQFTGTVPVQYQDPVMGPVAVMAGLESEYRNYSRAFFRALLPTRQTITDTDWLAVSVQGFNRDRVVSDFLRDNIALAPGGVIGMTRDAMIAWSAAVVAGEPVPMGVPIHINLVTHLTDAEIAEEMGVDINQLVASRAGGAVSGRGGRGGGGGRGARGRGGRGPQPARGRGGFLGALFGRGG